MNVERCLRQLRKIRDAAEDPESAYLLRSRVRRTLLVCMREVARDIGTSIPLALDEEGLRNLPPGRREAIIGACQRIRGLTVHLCQPSEALDDRWRREWADVDAELSILEGELLKIQAPKRMNLPVA